MDEFIERGVIMEMFAAYVKRSNNSDFAPTPTWNQAVPIVEDAPAADVAPVRHGRWIWDDEGYHCSECFYHGYGETGEILSGNWHYCPNCGAKMEVCD